MTTSEFFDHVDNLKKDYISRQERNEIGYEIVATLRLIELRKYWNKQADVVLGSVEEDLRKLVDKHFHELYFEAP